MSMLPGSLSNKHQIDLQNRTGELCLSPGEQPRSEGANLSIYTVDLREWLSRGIRSERPLLPATQRCLAVQEGPGDYRAQFFRHTEFRCP